MTRIRSYYCGGATLTHMLHMFLNTKAHIHSGNTIGRRSLGSMHTAWVQLVRAWHHHGKWLWPDWSIHIECTFIVSKLRFSLSSTIFCPHWQSCQPLSFQYKKFNIKICSGSKFTLLFSYLNFNIKHRVSCKIKFMDGEIHCICFMCILLL